MADLGNSTKLKLESIFSMSGGYVLDFSNGRFADFVRTSVGFDPYEKYQPGSKAVLLRTIWHSEPIEVVAKLNLELLEHWRVSKLLANQQPTAAEQALHDELHEEFLTYRREIAPSDLAFLEQDFGDIDLAALPRALTTQQVIETRLREIDACLHADAPLAVLFLVGSTLEGLLMELALSQAAQFTAAGAAPKTRTGSVKPVDAWTLSELISVSHQLGVLGTDVSKHADQVRNFRNYIHPRQQLKEHFEPRIETARIAHQVLRAALRDLSELASPSD